MSPARPDTAPAVKPIEVSGELKALMRRLKLGQLLDTLPERPQQLVLGVKLRQSDLGITGFSGLGLDEGVQPTLHVVPTLRHRATAVH